MSYSLPPMYILQLFTGRYHCDNYSNVLSYPTGGSIIIRNRQVYHIGSCGCVTMCNNFTTARISIAEVPLVRGYIPIRVVR